MTTSEYGLNVRSLIDFHLRRNGATVGLSDTHPVGSDSIIRALYEDAFVGVEACGDESGPAMVEEAAERVALALLVISFGPDAVRTQVWS